MAKKPKTKTEAQENSQSTKEKEMSEFISACGEKFNPKSKTCVRICKEENEESYLLCKENFDGMKAKSTNKKVVKAEKPSETSPKKETKKAKVKKEKPVKEKKTRIFDMFGDGRGTTASQINSLLICGCTMEQILDEIGTDHATGTNKNRVRAHFHSLKVADMDRRVMGPLEIFRDKESNMYFIDDERIEFFGDCDECGNGPVKPAKKVSKKKK